MVTKENHTNVGVTRIVMKAKRYSEELILENLTGNLIHEVYKHLRNYLCFVCTANKRCKLGCSEKVTQAKQNVYNCPRRVFGPRGPKPEEAP